MNKQSVIDIIRKIFIYYGYRIKSSDISDLHAVKDNEVLFIKFDPAVGFESLRKFSDNVERNKGKGILISEQFDDRIISYANEGGMTLWDRNRLESWIGRAVLSGALVEHDEKTEKEIDLSTREQAEKKPEYEKTLRLKLHSVPVNIGKSDSLLIAEEKVGIVKVQKLVFLPVWYYRYSIEAQKKFKSKVIDLTGEGEGYIHAITNENSFNAYKDIKDNIFVPTQNYEIKQPLVEKKNALGKAIDAIIRENTREVRINEMIGDTIVFENKVLTPDPEDIELEMDLLHIPVWEVSGNREVIEINAYDGHIISLKQSKLALV